MYYIYLDTARVLQVVLKKVNNHHFFNRNTGQTSLYEINTFAKKKKKITESHPGHFRIPIFQMLKTHGEKVVPIGEEECLL